MCLDHAKICDGWLDFHRAHGPPLETRASVTTECTHFFLCCVLKVSEVCVHVNGKETEQGLQNIVFIYKEFAPAGQTQKLPSVQLLLSMPVESAEVTV